LPAGPSPPRRATPTEPSWSPSFGDIATVPDYRTGDAFERNLAAGKIDAVMAPVIDLQSLARPAGLPRLVPAGPRFYADGILGFELAVGVRKADRVPHDMVEPRHRRHDPRR
jgi:ABC-type amino acid transport substrate-binding protein